MKEKISFSLTDLQKCEITKLLNLSDEKAPVIFDALEHLVQADGWLIFDSTGKVSSEKLAARRVRDLKSVSDHLGKLDDALSKIDRVILRHIDDQFSNFHFEMSQISNAKIDSRRTVIPLRELIKKTRDLTKNAAKIIGEDDSTGYLKRFLSELEEFW